MYIPSPFSIRKATYIKLGVTALITLSFFNESHSFSEDYRMGYVSCIITEVVPEEKLDFYVKGQELNIRLFDRDLAPDTKDKLVKRLKETNLFQVINISYVNSKDYPRAVPGMTLLGKHKPKETVDLLPEGVIYDTPLADPKWPRFSIGYQKHLVNTYGKKIFGLSFGENFAIVRYKTPGWTYEFGIQAGLTGLMDIGSSTTRLINSDYFVGAGFSFVHNGRWQNLIQLSHLSSHLGDELLISRPSYLNKRINLSYETIKWFSAYKFDSFRPYIGVGYQFHCDPSGLDRLTLEGGIDYVSKNKILWDTTRYVFGVYTHLWNQNRYKPTVNVRTGLQLENPIWGGRQLQFLAEYAYGRSRHGQFYAKREQYIGLVMSVSN